MDALQSWLLRTSLPLWLAHGVDRTAGAFHEALSSDTYICTADFRRLRVTARQTYVFARAHAAGVPGADEAAAIGVDFLLRRAALPEGGYATRFDLHGNPTDTSRDLYDHAFVLLALATAAAVLPASPLRRAALDTHAYIVNAFAHGAAGFREGLPGSLPRRQNPHMHLLEAALAAYRAFGDPAFLHTARGLVQLCLTRFIDPASGAVLEYFTDDLAPHAVSGAVVAEPGHCCEWVWLLDGYAAAAGPDVRVHDAAAALMRFVDRHGSHPQTGDLIDTVSASGAPLALTARLWPQTERLKAAVVRHDTSLAGREHAAARLARWLLPDGLWVERRDEDGRDIPGPAPASSLYHLTCALLPDAPRR
jgi:mannose-6-phosphate isomerase